MRFLFLLFAATISTLAAQAGTADEPPQESASFRFLALTDTGELKAPGGEKINTARNIVGLPVRLPATNGQIRLGKLGAPDPKTGEAQFKTLVAFAPMNAEPRQLVLLSRGRNGLAACVIPDNAAHLPYGRALILNLTPTPLEFRLGGAKVRVPPGKTMLSSEKAAPDAAGDLRVTIRTAAPQASDATLYSTVWPPMNNSRRLVFATPSADGGVEITAIEDIDTPALREAPAHRSKSAR